MKYWLRLLIGLGVCTLYLLFKFPLKEFRERITRKCFKNIYKDYCLVLNFNSPSLYENAEALRELYTDVFGVIIICGPKPDINFGKYKPNIEFENEGRFGYHCLSLAIDKYPNYKGYFYGNGNMIINWWNFDQHKLLLLWKAPNWRLIREHKSDVDVEHKSDVETYSKNNNSNIAESCQNYYEVLRKYVGTDKKVFDGNKGLNTYLGNGKGKRFCGHGWSNFFYVPKSFAKSFSFLSKIAYRHKTHSETAVPIIFWTLDRKNKLHTMESIVVEEPNFSKLFWHYYETRKTVFEGTFVAKELLDSHVMKYKRKLVSC